MSDDELNLDQIHEAFRPKIHRYLVRLVGEYEAEDLTQEVFVKVGQALDTFRGESQLSTWIYRIATHAAIDKMRTPSYRQDAQKSSLDEAAEEDRLAWLGEEGSPLEQELMRKEMYRCFANFVRDLAPNYRTVFVLSELEGLTNNEIADVLGLSLSTVKIRLHRGRARLLQQLKDYCRAEDWL